RLVSDWSSDVCSSDLVLGASIVLGLFLLAVIGPMITAHAPLAFDAPTDARPSSSYWFGTTSFGQDVFSQFVNGLRAAFLVGAVEIGRASCRERVGVSW